MDTLTISGKTYISGIRAAKQNGYTADYIGQLIRSGKLKGQKVGRAWYVLEDSLNAFLAKENGERTIEEAQSAAEALEPPEPEPLVRATIHTIETPVGGSFEEEHGGSETPLREEEGAAVMEVKERTDTEHADEEQYARIEETDEEKIGTEPAPITAIPQAAAFEDPRQAGAAIEERIKREEARLAARAAPVRSAASSAETRLPPRRDHILMNYLKESGPHELPLEKKARAEEEVPIAVHAAREPQTAASPAPVTAAMRREVPGSHTPPRRYRRGGVWRLALATVLFGAAGLAAGFYGSLLIPAVLVYTAL